jgi:hypothetical protein
VLGALVRLPNVVPSTGFFPEAPSISINGSNGLDTNYLIDGLDNNENFLGGIKFPVPLGFTREVTVLANSYSVAYGRTANGIVNYTSPSGSNDCRARSMRWSDPAGRSMPLALPAPRPVGQRGGRKLRALSGGLCRGRADRARQDLLYANLEYTRDRNTQVVDAPRWASWTPSPATTSSTSARCGSTTA